VRSRRVIWPCAALILALMPACSALSTPSSGTTPTELPPGTTAADTPSPTSTAVRVAPRLPDTYESRYLNPLDAAHLYVDNHCTYLRNKWDPAKAPPGTIVLPIMLHSINQGRAEGGDAINEVMFARMMDDLHEQQFQAINMGQLAEFLESNAWIPERSVILIQDGRRYPGNFEDHFRHYWETWGWPVVNAWDHQGTTTDVLWDQYAMLAEQGMVDYQVYGPTFDPAVKPRTDEYLSMHLQTPIDLLRERLATVPIAVVWPSGYSHESIQIARELGYRLGFTFNPRGPLMYNWIPLSTTDDKLRPSYKPEGQLGDPLMTLPRYWPQQVHDALDEVRITSKDAAVYAEQNKATELEYYDIVCASEHGPIPLQ
jgi:hypothetical protein